MLTCLSTQSGSHTRCWAACWAATTPASRTGCPDEVYLRSHFLVLNTYLILHHRAFLDCTDRREQVIRAVGGACSVLLTRPY
jgi:hypothetical protein